MQREEVLARLRERLPLLRAQYGIESLALFGSVAREDARPDSDIDLLVTFEGAPTFAGYMGLKEDLEALLGCPVDLVTPGGLKARIREKVFAELFHVA